MTNVDALDELAGLVAVAAGARGLGRRHLARHVNDDPRCQMRMAVTAGEHLVRGPVEGIRRDEELAAPSVRRALLDRRMGMAPDAAGEVVAHSRGRERSDLNLPVTTIVPGPSYEQSWSDEDQGTT